MRSLRRDEMMTLHFLRERGTWCLDELDPGKRKIFAKIMRGLVRLDLVNVDDSDAGPAFSLTAAGENELDKNGDSIG